jgi:S-adenosylmethionine:tRNA-ribosyltransferase-isomerase (queuine synthetase)
MQSNTPITTRNSLADIIGWLKEGDLVILHIGDISKAYIMTEKERNRCVTIDISTAPSLMEEGEWPWYIKNEGAIEVTDIKPYYPAPNGTYKFKLPNIYAN